MENETLPPVDVELGNALSSFSFFAGASRNADDWIARATRLTLAAGEILFRQGDPPDSLCFVLQGTLEVSVAHDMCARTVLAQPTAGAVLGEIAFLTGGKRSATVRALTDCTLAVLRTTDVRSLLAQDPGMKRRLLEIARDRLRMTQCARIMERYFKEVDTAVIRFMQSHLEWVHVNRGDIVLRKGDKGDSLHFLVHGLLQVVDADADAAGRSVGLGLVYRGETVGETSLLAEEERAASVRALRDSDLVRLTKDAFQEVSAEFPELTLAIAKVLVDRLKARGRGNKRGGPVSVALLQASPGVPLAEFSRRLQAALCSMEQTVLINSRTVQREFSEEPLPAVGEDDPRALELVAWLEEHEATASLALYEADAAYTTWSRRCVERADRVFVVAMADEDPDSGLVAALRAAGTGGAEIDLVLVHRDGSAAPTRTVAWLDALAPTRHHHVNWQSNADFGRVARMACGRSVGLVLGGGGAKGFAHIGVLRALAEAGIPVDMIGGSSMGSIIAGLHALGWGPERMADASKDIFLKQNPFREVTLPLISIVRCRKLDKVLHAVYGDRLIEELPLRFFGTSSNLSSCALKVHRRGPLWKAIRMSCSLPVIMAPVPFEGEVHLDGGVLNNLPCDVMRTEAGYVIAVDVDTQGEMVVDFDEFPSPWKLMWDGITRKKTGRAPNIVDITLATFRASNRMHVARAKECADLCIDPPVAGIGMLDFARVDEVVQIGYDCTRRILATLPKSSPLRAVQAGACLDEPAPREAVRAG